LAPVLVWLVYAGATGVVFAGVVLVAFVSDYFDGVIARRLGVASAELRHFDSRADLVFYATAAWAVPVAYSFSYPTTTMPPPRSASIWTANDVGKMNVCTRYCLHWLAK